MTLGLFCVKRYQCRMVVLSLSLHKYSSSLYSDRFIEFLVKNWLIYFVKVKRLDTPVKSYDFIYCWSFNTDLWSSSFLSRHLSFLKNCWWHSSTMSLCIDFRMFHKFVSSLLTLEPLNGLNRFKKVKSLKFQAETIGLIAFIPGLHLSFKFGFGGFYNSKWLCCLCFYGLFDGICPLGCRVPRHHLALCGLSTKSIWG